MAHEDAIIKAFLALYRGDNFEVALLQEGFVVVPLKPTEEMVDAPRGLFLYFAAPPQRGWTLGGHLAAGGYPTGGLTTEELAWDGTFPKAQRASMVYRMMVAAS